MLRLLTLIICLLCASARGESKSQKKCKRTAPRLSIVTPRETLYGKDPSSAACCEDQEG